MKQIDLWDSKINEIPTSDEERRLLDLALLERAAAGLNLDALSVKTTLPCAEFTIESTRTELKELLKKFKAS